MNENRGQTILSPWSFVFVLALLLIPQPSVVAGYSYSLKHAGGRCRAYSFTYWAGGGQLVPTLVANWTYQSSFRENDIVVTTESAQYPSYALLQPVPFDKNHSTIGMEDIANQVIYKLWLSEVQDR
jgi:hypothetical protein